MAFHVVYSRHYWDHEDPGTFANSWTITEMYRILNCSK